ncbi:MAG: hypothetical protein AAB611_02475 [Patescibacteria group bacterium]
MDENLNKNFVDRLKKEVSMNIATPEAIHPDDKRAYAANKLEVAESVFKDLRLAAQSEAMSSEALLKMIEMSQEELRGRMVHANKEGQESPKERFQTLETKRLELEKQVRDMRSKLEYCVEELGRIQQELV